MRVALAANRSLGVSKVAMHLLDQLYRLPSATLILLRRPREDEPGEFEQHAAALAETLGFEVEWRIPEPGGRAAVMARNIEMARDADTVICYFDNYPGEVSVTGHLLDKAVEHDKAVIRAFDCTDDGISLVGSWEPEPVT